MSNRFTYVPTSQKPPPVCKKGPVEGPTVWTPQAPSFQAWVEGRWPESTGIPQINWTGPLQEIGTSDIWIHIEQINPEWTWELVLLDLTPIGEWEGEIAVYRFGGLFALSVVTNAQWRSTRPWDSGLARGRNFVQQVTSLMRFTT